MKIVGLLGLLAIPAFASSPTAPATTEPTAPASVATPAPAAVKTPFVTAKGKGATAKPVKVKAASAKGRRAAKK